MIDRNRRTVGLLPAIAAAAWAVFAPAGAQSPPADAPAAAAASPAPRVVAPAVPVRLDGETVFSVRAPLGPFTVEERAAAAEVRLRRLADDPFYSAELFTVQEAEGVTRILYGETVVGHVTEQDAAGEGATREALAATAIAHVKQAIADYHARRQPAAKNRGWAVLGIATVAFAGFLALVGWAHRRVLARVDQFETRGTQRFLQKYLSVTAGRVAAIERRAIGFLRLAAIAVAALIFLQVAFTFFPLTRGYALTVLAYVTDPITSLWRGFLSSISDLFAAGVLIVLVYYFLKGLRWLFTEVAAGKVSLPGIAREWALPMYKLVRIVVIALAVVMVFPYIPGSGTQAFKGLSLFAGALFTLGATGTIGNFIGGLVAMFVGAFRIGDWVKIGEVTGEVMETTLVLTRIRTQKNEIVTVPNSSILSTQVVNYSVRAREDGVILHTSVTIGYDAPWRTVHRLLIDAALRTPRIEKTPAPFVLQTALNDFFITYEINAYTRVPVLSIETYGELHQNIQDAFNEEGVEIMSPHFAAVRDGNTIAIPEASRKPEDHPRRFEVRVERDERAPER